MKVFLIKLEYFLRNIVSWISNGIRCFFKFISDLFLAFPSLDCFKPQDMNITINNCPKPEDSCSPNSLEDCEIIDSVVVNGCRYAIDFMPGIIRVYNTNQSNVYRTISHNLGTLKSIRYINNFFVVEDQNSYQFRGIVNGNSIIFIPNV